jgi:hypothetical protein
MSKFIINDLIRLYRIKTWPSIVLIGLMASLTIGCLPKKIVISAQIIQASGLAVSRADVKTIPPTDITTTNKDGYFYLRRTLQGSQEMDIPPGRYIIRVEKEGYQPLEFSVTAEKGNVWAKKHIMRTEQALIEKVAPEKSEEEVIAPAQAPKIGF